MKIFSAKINRGFTLIEMLVAVSIFTTAMLGSMTVLDINSLNAKYALQKITATYLAQEGIEFIRNLRDTEMLYNTNGTTTSGWIAFLYKEIGTTYNGLCNDSNSQGNNCFYYPSTLFSLSSPMPVSNMVQSACDTTPNCSNGPIYYNPSTGLYSEGSGSPGYTTKTMYTRAINILPISLNAGNTPAPATNEVQVISKVYWYQGGALNHVTLSENITDWIQ